MRIFPFVLILAAAGCEQPPAPESTAHKYRFGDEADKARAYEMSPEVQAYLREVERIAREDRLRRLRDATGIR